MSKINDSILQIKNLRVHYPLDSVVIHALDDVSLELERGGALGIVGETGSGKTTLAKAVMRLLTREWIGGEIFFDGANLLDASDEEMRRIRWKKIALAFQGAGSSFDPVYSIGAQIVEPLREHLHIGAGEAKERAQCWLERAGLEKNKFDSFPHELSGGEKQRAMIAMALACEPELLIVDEPASGLDVLTKAELVQMLQDLRANLNLSMMVISHDISVVTRLTDKLAVLYAGKLAEVGGTRDLVDTPRHPYTWGLINAFPTMTRTQDLAGIRGQFPDLANPPRGCRFHPRCTQAVEECRNVEPPLATHNGRLIACHLGGLQLLLDAQNLKKTFARKTGIFSSPEKLAAVRDANLQIREGEVVALVGQTGSGKTTLAKMILGLVEPDAGQVFFENENLRALHGDVLKLARRRIQMIFQDPFEALSPRLALLDLVMEPLDIQNIGARAERVEMATRALRAVNLPTVENFLRRFTHELSGGQLQRVAIARALVLEPKLILADEPVSMLDASEAAKVLKLLKELQNERGMGLLLISHDLATVRKIADRIVVMRHGEIVETGPSHRVIAAPQHAYTRELLAASLIANG